MVDNPSETTLCDHCQNQFIPEVNHPPIPTINLRSHLEPTQAERAQMFAFIQAEEHEIERYEVELQHLQRLFKKLSSEQDVHKRRVEERKCWVSSALRVPKEVWCEIFTLACGSMASLDISSENIAAGPLNLSHVCFYWRNVIITFPKLWSAMKIELYPLSMGVKNIVELFLQNSASQPLKVRLDVNSDFYNYEPSIFTIDEYLGQYGFFVLQALLSASPRFNTLKITFPGELFPDNLRRVLAFPELETLIIHDDHEVDTRTSWFWDKVKNASKLRHLTVPHDSLFRTSDVTPPTHVSTISIGSGTADSALSVLRRCPQLTEFSWTNYRDPLTPLAQTPMSFPNLRKVHLSSVPLDDVCHFFASVTLPAVTSVSMNRFIRDLDVAPPEWSSAKAFVDMLERSGSPVQRLTLDVRDVYLPLNELLRILRVCGNLKILDVMTGKRRRTTPDGFFHALLRFLTVTDSTTGEVLVPKLTHLRLHEVSGSRRIRLQTQERLIEVAESRKVASELGSAGVSALKDVEISFSKAQIQTYSSRERVLELDSGISRRVEELRRDGMKYTGLWIQPGPRHTESFAAEEDDKESEPEDESEDEDDGEESEEEDSGGEDS